MATGKMNLSSSSSSCLAPFCTGRPRYRGSWLVWASNAENSSECNYIYKVLGNPTQWMHAHKCVNLKKAANIQDDANSFGSRHTSDQKNTD